MNEQGYMQRFVHLANLVMLLKCVGYIWTWCMTCLLDRQEISLFVLDEHCLVNSLKNSVVSVKRPT